jgi:hypothetical protein
VRALCTALASLRGRLTHLRNAGAVAAVAALAHAQQAAAAAGAAAAARATTQAQPPRGHDSQQRSRRLRLLLRRRRLRLQPRSCCVAKQAAAAHSARAPLAPPRPSRSSGRSTARARCAWRGGVQTATPAATARCFRSRSLMATSSSQARGQTAPKRTAVSRQLLVADAPRTQVAAARARCACTRLRGTTTCLHTAAATTTATTMMQRTTRALATCRRRGWAGRTTCSGGPR